MMRRSLSVFAVACAALLAAAAEKPHLSNAVIERKVDSLLSIMTLEEKLGQLNQLSGQRDTQTGDKISTIQKEMIRKGLVGSFLNVSGAEATRKIQRIAVEESRLHIPLIFGLDVIHGFRTIFPIPLAEASTWDPEAVEQSARAAAVEASASGIHWTFAPMVDIARDPRWGRIAEGSGEDPYLGSVMSAARVRGFQGTNLASNTSILACAKHFAGYGAAEGGRDYNTVDVSERTLREIYLPPFKAAVTAGAGTLMCSFNEIAGMPSSANRKLLTSVLRGEWGFDGFVVSDWNSIGELPAHGIAGSREEAGILAITAGVDMDMESRIYGSELIGMIREKRLSEETVNQAVRRVLRIKFKLGLFDDPYKACDASREKSDIFNEKHKQTARKVAQESIVLLKNEKGLLPLSKDVKTIAVLGPLADNRSDPLGPWWATGNPDETETVLEGIKAAVSPQMKVLYAKGCEISGRATDGFDEALAAARQADVVVLVIGESADMSGEAASRSSLDLPGVQHELVRAIHETGKPGVLILMNGRPLSIAWEAEHVPAILEAWLPGTMTGSAIADVLFGDVNPGGKLPVSVPRAVGQVPIYYNHKNTGRPPSGEKYTSKYIDLPSTPLYPFGHGLSYTTFSYSNLKLSRARLKAPIAFLSALGEKDRMRGSVLRGERRSSDSTCDSLKISVDVTNAGKLRGDEVVQLYIQDEVASVTRPVKELKDFRRIMLEPGETKNVSFSLPIERLVFYDKDMKLTVEPGFFRVFVGTNSVDTQEAEFEVVAE